MKLNKEICKECAVRFLPTEGWNKNDEEQWDKQLVFCYAEAIKPTSLAVIRTWKIPDDCLFKLEQTVLGQKEQIENK